MASGISFQEIIVAEGSVTKITSNCSPPKVSKTIQSKTDAILEGSSRCHNDKISQNRSLHTHLDRGRVVNITINRPKSLNSLTPAVLKELQVALTQVQQNNNLRVITIWGGGDKAFVAGADIPTMTELDQKGVTDFVSSGQDVMRMIETARVPVIAAVQGFALGGGLELALACDLIIASKKAKVGQPEVNLGIIPGFGGTQRLVQRCGVGTARRLVYTGDIISANEALQLGVVDKVTEPDQLEATVESIAETITQKGPLAIQKAKEVIRTYGDNNLTAGLASEVQAFLGLFDTEDRKEGMEAFLEKRSAQFKGV